MVPRILLSTTHNVMHWMAVRDQRECPECGFAILPGQPWMVVDDEVLHGPCGQEKYPSPIPYLHPNLRSAVADIPTCFRCRKSAEEIGEYVDAARDENEYYKERGMKVRITPTDWMLREEGTYNPETRHFCCTKCYIEIGMPVGEAGRRWRAP